MPTKDPFRCFLAAFLALSLSGASRRRRVLRSRTSAPGPKEGEVGLLKLLGLEAPPESIDYVQNKTQFQLHTLLTEQRHPKTWNLSEQIAKDTAAGLRMLFSVDEDIAARLDALASETKEVDEAAGAVEEAIRVRKQDLYLRLRRDGPAGQADGKLVLEAFLEKGQGPGQSLGEARGRRSRRHRGAAHRRDDGGRPGPDLFARGLRGPSAHRPSPTPGQGRPKGDVVICVTEGGETSSVIGTVLGALDQWKTEPGYDPAVSRRNLYFVYNNPDDKLLPFLRSRTVIEEPGITKINLTTGPQSITGSTRMQATTIETYVVGNILQAAAQRMLGEGAFARRRWPGSGSRMRFASTRAFAVSPGCWNR